MRLEKLKEPAATNHDAKSKAGTGSAARSVLGPTQELAPSQLRPTNVNPNPEKVKWAFRTAALLKYSWSTTQDSPPQVTMEFNFPTHIVKRSFENHGNLVLADLISRELFGNFQPFVRFFEYIDPKENPYVQPVKVQTLEGYELT